jgi:hypothetical protein
MLPMMPAGLRVDPEAGAGMKETMMDVDWATGVWANTAAAKRNINNSAARILFLMIFLSEPFVLI